MFNRVFFDRQNNPRSSMGLCFLCGLIAGLRMNSNKYTIDAYVLPFMTMLAALRFAGDIDQRVSRMVGMASGILVGVAVMGAFRNNVIEKPVTSPSPSR